MRERERGRQTDKETERENEAGREREGERGLEQPDTCILSKTLGKVRERRINRRREREGGGWGGG